MANLKLNELLDIAGNKLENGVLTIKDIGDAVTIFITGDSSIKKIVSHLDRIKLSLSGGDDNQIEVIELKRPGAELAARSVRDKTLIVVNKTARILSLGNIELESRNDIFIDTSKVGV